MSEDTTKLKFVYSELCRAECVGWEADPAACVRKLADERDELKSKLSAQKDYEDACAYWWKEVLRLTGQEPRPWKDSHKAYLARLESLEAKEQRLARIAEILGPPLRRDLPYAERCGNSHCDLEIDSIEEARELQALLDERR